MDECSDNTLNDCDKTNGICNNTDGSFICQCKTGWTGDGKTCTGIIFRFSELDPTKRNVREWGVEVQSLHTTRIVLFTSRDKLKITGISNWLATMIWIAQFGLYEPRSWVKIQLRSKISDFGHPLEIYYSLSILMNKTDANQNKQVPTHNFEDN